MRHTCILHTLCNAHQVLHRLQVTALTLVAFYCEVDLPYHAGSTADGTLYLTRLLPNGDTIPLKVSQINDRQLSAEIVAPAFDNAENIKEALGPLVLAYLASHTNPEDMMQQEFRQS
ncbi:MAG: hypothetical protein RIQ71_603 [Verrucomicrobiota bacterium]